MKDKIYYFQEKSNDILDLQDELTIEEIGMHFILKAAYFKNFGELTESNLVQRCRFFGDKEKLLKLAEKLFEFKEGCLINNSWLSQIKGIKEKSDERKKAANIRWQKEQEKDGKPKKPKKNLQEPTGLFIPNFIEAELWNGFLEMRIKAKAKPTNLAIKGIIQKLQEFEDKKTGWANESLKNSIENNWKGVFEPKTNYQSKSQSPLAWLNK